MSLSRTTAESITEALLKFLRECELDLTYLRGQGYDGAAAMAGKLTVSIQSVVFLGLKGFKILGHVSGVQARIRSHFPKAAFVHCAAHTLNLALTDASTVCSIAFALSVVKEATIFFTYSPKRMELLKEVIETTPGMTDTDRTRLILQCNTR